MFYACDNLQKEKINDSLFIYFRKHGELEIKIKRILVFLNELFNKAPRKVVLEFNLEKGP